MEITATMVRELREKSGAPMMACKKALTAAGGDLEVAFDNLRKAGLKSAEKKAAREMGEGRVVADASGSVGVIAAVTCETDFVAKTPDFEAFLTDLVGHVREQRPADVAELLGQTWASTGSTVDEAIKVLVGKLGENISVARLATYENPNGRVGAYVHHNNKVGVLVSVTTSKGDEAESTIRDLCLHIAAIKPEFLKREEVPADVLEREKDIYRDEVKNKPENIQDKILAGKLEKYYADRILPEQPWVKDDKLTVAKAVEQTLGSDAGIESFSRYEIGG